MVERWLMASAVLRSVEIGPEREGWTPCPVMIGFGCMPLYIGYRGPRMKYTGRCENEFNVGPFELCSIASHQTHGENWRHFF